MCTDCHESVERGPRASLPSVNTCMICHSEIKKESPEIRKIAAAAREGRPIAWARVHDLPDFTCFDHSAHVNQGVACQTCHGPVESMARVEQSRHMSMGWCVSCHVNGYSEKEGLEAAGYTAQQAAPGTTPAPAALASGERKKARYDCANCHY